MKHSFIHDQTRFATEFVAYCQKHIKVDEKGEAQHFLERFFIALGHEGVKDVGAEWEVRIKDETQNQF